MWSQQRIVGSVGKVVRDVDLLEQHNVGFADKGRRVVEIVLLFRAGKRVTIPAGKRQEASGTAQMAIKLRVWFALPVSLLGRLPPVLALSS